MCYMGLHFSNTFPWVLQHFECERECERKCEKSVSRSVRGVWGRGEGGGGSYLKLQGPGKL